MDRSNSSNNNDPSETRSAEMEERGQMTSQEVNVLLFNYLQETGLQHTAFSLLHESALQDASTSSGTSLLEVAIPTSHLIRLLHKGLLYVEAEARWRGEDTKANPPRLLGADIHETVPTPRLIKTVKSPPAPETKRTKPRSASQSISTGRPAKSAGKTTDTIPETDEQTLAIPEPSHDASSTENRSAPTSAAISREPSPPPPLPQATYTNGKAASNSPEISTVPLSSGSGWANKRKDRDESRSGSASLQRDDRRPPASGVSAMDIDRPSPAPSESERDSKRVKLEVLTDATSAAASKVPLSKPTSVALPPQPTLAAFHASRSETSTPAARLTPKLPVVTVRTISGPPRPMPAPSAPVNGLRNTAQRRSSSPHNSRKDSAASVALTRSTSAGQGARSSSPEVARKLKQSPSRKELQSDNAAATAKNQVLSKANGKDPTMGIISDSRVLTLVGHSTSSQAVSWNPKVSNMLVTGSMDATARVWELSDAVAGQITECAVCAHKNGSKKPDVPVIAWNPDGTLFATGSEDGLVRLWDASGELYNVLTTQQGGGVYSIKWNNKGTCILSASLDSTVCCYDVGQNRLLQHYRSHNDGVMDCDWYNDEIFVSCSKDRSLHVFSINRQQPLGRLRGHSDEVNACKFDSSKTYLASCSDDTTVRIWSLASTIPDKPRIERPDGSGIDQKGGFFVLHGHTKEVQSITWSPHVSTESPHILASVSFDRTARLWNADLGTCLYLIDRHTEVVYSLSFSPSGDRFVTGSDDRRASIFRTKDGELLQEYIHPGAIYEALWHPTNNQIAVTGYHPDVKLLSVPE